MAKEDKIPAVEKVRVMDPEWHVKFKSLKELQNEKRYSKSSSDKLNLPKSQSDTGA